MSGFQNPLQTNGNTFPSFPYLGSNSTAINPTWIDGTTQSVGFPNGYIPTGYQQQHGQIIYPVLQNSQGFASQLNLNQLPQTFQESLLSQNSLWNPGSVLLPSSPNLASPIHLTGPVVTNPQFLPLNFGNPTEQLLTRPLGMTNQLAPATFDASQQQLQMSLAQLNANYQQQQLWLLQQQQKQQEQHQQQKQQQEQQQQNKQEREQHLLDQEQQLQHFQQQDLQQHQQQHLQMQGQQQYPQQQEQKHNLQQKEQEQQLKQQDQQLKQQEQQRHLEQKELQQYPQQKEKHQYTQQKEQEHHLKKQEQQKHLQQQQQQKQEKKQHEHLYVHREQPNQASVNFSPSNKDTNTTVTETNVGYSVHSPTTGNKQSTVHTTSTQEASLNASVGGSNHPRQNTLPITLPTSLNPSLQIKSQMSPEFAAPQKKQTFNQSPTLLQADVDLNTMEGATVDVQSSRQEFVNASTSLSHATSSQDSTSTSVRTEKLLPDYTIIKPVYDKPKQKDHCLRCNKKVYPMERTGPIKEVVYHKHCFTCVRCGTFLNLKNFQHNPNDAEDLSIFCISHKPKERTSSCDANSVHIKSALTAPKLDRVNEQIRSDRQPSEVLARPSYFKPAASALTTSREHFYYGMQVTENGRGETLQQPQPENQIYEQQHKHQEHHHQSEQQEAHREMQQSQKQEYDQSLQLQEQSHEMQHQLKKQEQQVFDMLVHQNIEIQHQMIENDKKLSNDFSNIKLSQSEEANTVLLESDDVFLAQDQNLIPPIPRKDKTSTILSSSIVHQEISSADSIGEYIATHFQFDNHDALLQQKQNLFTADGMQILSDRRPASIQSSRSTSPMQIQTSSRSTEDNESRRSSYSSNLSSRDSVDLGASAVTYSGRQQSVSSPNERADRPSSFHNSSNGDEPNEKSQPGRMIEKNKMDYNLEIKHQNTDSGRFLPKNERMRMDRPSQYT